MEMLSVLLVLSEGFPARRGISLKQTINYHVFVYDTQYMHIHRIWYWMESVT